ncbi:hypothetical protein HELRODRAFT_179566 [Helobdella robusta]|uniref:Uncharacterized protein n=1 Tax=Helobdella robusta TaxID=6412 RepID=T1FEV7_HELRO|nr:hypothetical protein HELRODRAFT_179566 [Helobdella robusta]ESN95230.1 hypothetical protein HELRODRAFT_179566 [Helobdella robusta]
MTLRKEGFLRAAAADHESQCDKSDRRTLANKWRKIINHPRQGQMVFAMSLLDGIIKYVPGSNYILRYDHERRQRIAWRLVAAIDAVITSLHRQDQLEKVLHEAYDGALKNIGEVPFSVVQAFMRSFNEAGKNFNWSATVFNRCLIYLYEEITSFH